MQSSTFRVISGLITLLLLAALIGVVVLTMRSQPATLVLPTPAPQPTLTPTATPPLTVTLGAELNVAPGGYAIKLPIGYNLDLQGSAVKLSDTVSKTLTAAFWLDGGPVTSFVGGDTPTLAAAFAQYTRNFCRSERFRGRTGDPYVGGRRRCPVG